jgi:hypothetical protein
MLPEREKRGRFSFAEPEMVVKRTLMVGYALKWVYITVQPPGFSESFKIIVRNKSSRLCRHWS